MQCSFKFVPVPQLTFGWYDLISLNVYNTTNSRSYIIEKYFYLELWNVEIYV